MTSNLDELRGTLLHRHFLNKREKTIHNGLLTLSHELSEQNLELKMETQELRLKSSQQASLLQKKDFESQNSEKLKGRVSIISFFCV